MFFSFHTQFECDAPTIPNGDSSAGDSTARHWDRELRVEALAQSEPSEHAPIAEPMIHGPQCQRRGVIRSYTTASESVQQLTNNEKLYNVASNNSVRWSTAGTTRSVSGRLWIRSLDLWNCESSQVNSSQVVGLRDRVAIIRALASCNFLPPLLYDRTVRGRGQHDARFRSAFNK